MARELKNLKLSLWDEDEESSDLENSELEDDESLAGEENPEGEVLE